MKRKISLVYEENKYSVYVNDTVIETNDNREEIFNTFNQAVKNNSGNDSVQKIGWEELVEEIKSINDIGIDIDQTYKTISFENIKYFEVSGKVFNMSQYGIVEIAGGIDFFINTINLVKNGKIENIGEFISLFRAMTEEKINYKLADERLFITSPGFPYGSIEYSFDTLKGNTGTAIQKMSFDEFSNYVTQIINK